MMVVINYSTLITLAAVATAIIAFYNYFAKVVRWMDKQKKQDNEIREIKEEQQLLVYGILACLKGLHEQGCNGEVTKAINTIEKHINKEAHK